MKEHLLASCAVLALMPGIVHASSAAPQDAIVGRVVEVNTAIRYPDGDLFRATRVRVEIEGELHPRFGDPVRFRQEVPGVGAVDVEGDWVVIEVREGEVVATPAGAAILAIRADFSHPIDPTAGQQAVIRSERPRSASQLAAATELFEAAESGEVAAVRRVLASGVDADVRGPRGMTVLGPAAVAGEVEIVNALLEAGADPTVIVRGISLIAGVASEEGSGSGLAALLAAGADPDATGGYGLSPLHWAADGVNTWLNALQLVRAGADLEARTSVDVPMRQVRRSLFAEQNRGQLVAELDRSAATPLVYAALYGSEETLVVLLAAGADPNATNGAGQTALDLARAEPVCEECVAILEDPDAALAVLTERVQDAMKDALGRDADLGRVRLLLTLGADPNAVDDDGEAPLHWLAQDPADDLPVRDAVAALVAAGAQIDLPFEGAGLSPLILAAGYGELEAAAALIEYGASVDFQAGGEEDGAGAGYTALMVAAVRGDVEMVRRLLDAGADRALRAADGMTAADLAVRADHLELAESLR